MSNFIDRRLNPKDKTIRNRQKFIERSKESIRKEIKKVIEEGSIKDISTTKTKIKVKGITEPSFSISRNSGTKKHVLPGNKQYIPGDLIEKPQNNPNGDGSKASNQGDGEDDFEFLLTHDEFVDFLMEELELPNLIKTQLKDVNQFENTRAGFKSYGTPNQVDIIRSLKGAIGRRIGMNRPKDEDIKELESKIEEAKETGNPLLEEMIKELEALKAKRDGVPWIDPFDMRYRNFTQIPKPISKAVMFCIMDVSGSMGEREKDISKRFFLLLHVFLKKKYKDLDVVFIAHHTSASEVDEDTFFYGKETGGTIVSTAMELTNKIIDERYNPADYNIYVAQCSDGDNFPSDEDLVVKETIKIMERTQYMAYLEVGNPSYSYMTTTNLWSTYTRIKEMFPNSFNMKIVMDSASVWMIFQELFSKEKVNG